MKLEFKPLPHRPAVLNAVVPVNQHCRLSVSYGPGVGKPGSYEAGIQMLDPDRYPGMADLVYFRERKYKIRRVYQQCSEAKLAKLFKLAAKQVYVGAIEVFDVACGSPERTPKSWGIQALCADGLDLERKLEYAKSVWSTEGYRFIPVGEGTRGLPVPAASEGSDQSG